MALSCLLLTWGCHEDNQQDHSGDGNTTYTPLVITKEMRAVAWDLGDVQSLTNDSSIPMATIREELPAVILRRQFYDEFGESINTGEHTSPYDFASRILQLQEEVETFLGDNIDYDVHMDLQTMSKTSLSGPSSTIDNGYSFATRVNGTETEYRTNMVQAVTTVAQEVQPRRFIVGTAMNLYAATPEGADDWDNFVNFFIEKLKPAIKKASPQTMVSVGLFWDDMITQSNLKADNLATSQFASITEARAKTDQDLFLSLMNKLINHVDEIALSTSPTSSRMNALEDDHYRRLLPLTGQDKPIVFMEVWSSHTTAEVDYPAVWLLEKFRQLAGGLNVAQVAWSRIRDVPGTERCAKIMANHDVPISMRFCNAGLFDSGGTHKPSLWPAYLDTSSPTLD